jgi:hypothetical protein
MAIFLTLFQGLMNIANTNLKGQWVAMQTAFYESLATKDDSLIDLTAENFYGFDTSEELYKYITNEANYTVEQIAAAKVAVAEAFDANNEPFLWIKSLWHSDTIAPVVPHFDDVDRNVFGTVAVNETNLEHTKTLYQFITDDLRAERGNNGLYILIVLVTLVTAASILVMRWATGGFKKKKEGDTSAPATPGMPGGKIMLIIMPAVMLIFSFTTNASFAIYIFTSQLVATATTPLTAWISRLVDKKQEAKKEATAEISYRRKN